MRGGFYPGSIGMPRTSSRLIKYGALSAGKTCICDTNDDNKVKKDATDYNALQVSTIQRRAILLRSAVNGGYGGKTQFATQYTGGTVVNYLGRVEGQSGGSGRPPRNQFI